MAKQRIDIGGDPRGAALRAAEVFRAGGVVIFPTETVYGIGALATDARAVERLRDLKGRTAAKPFQFLVADMDMARRMGAVFSSQAARLARSFWPGPLTLVVPDGTASEGTLGVRVPDSEFVHALCRELGGAIVSSSANPGGEPPPIDSAAADVFGDAVDLLVDGGKAVDGVPSTVVRCLEGNFEILRSGGLSDEQICAAWNGAIV